MVSVRLQEKLMGVQHSLAKGQEKKRWSIVSSVPVSHRAQWSLSGSPICRRDSIVLVLLQHNSCASLAKFQFLDDKCFVADRMMQEIDLLRPNEIHKTTTLQVAALLWQIDAQWNFKVSLVSSNVSTRNEISRWNMVKFLVSSNNQKL
jgi:hypothetical protein